MGQKKTRDRLRKALGDRAGYCPYMEAVIWGAPGLRGELEAAGVAMVESQAARVALVRVEHERDLDAIRRLREQGQELPILVMVGGDNRAALALAAVELGALGLLGDDAPVGEVAAALGEVAAGRPFVAPSGAELLLQAVRARGEARGSFALTPRERDVLGELVTGLTTEEIASRLQVGHTTVQTHLKSLYRKLAVNSRAAATAVALRHRLV